MLWIIVFIISSVCFIIDKYSSITLYVFMITEGIVIVQIFIGTFYYKILVAKLTYLNNLKVTESATYATGRAEYDFEVERLKKIKKSFISRFIGYGWAIPKGINNLNTVFNSSGKI